MLTAHANRRVDFNGLNQLTASGAASLTYDPRGNLTSDGTVTYAYNGENQLTSLVSPSQSITFAYDPLMRLAVEDSTSNGLDASLAYDGPNIVQEALSDGRTRRYVYGPGTDEVLYSVLIRPTASTIYYWHHADERGSIVRTSDELADAYGTGRYDEYGAGGGPVGRFRYTGQYWLGEGQLHSFRARVYHPTLGRFLQTDPIGYGDGMNMYAYVRGDPVNARDPSGTERICTGTGAARRCVLVDGDGNGNADENDVPPSIEQRIESAWGGPGGVIARYGTTSGIDVSSFGKPVRGFGASDNAQAMLRVGTQILRYIYSIATSSEDNGAMANRIRDNWSRIGEIHAFSNGRRAGPAVELLGNGPGIDGRERFTLVFHGGFGFGDARDIYASPPDIIRALLHETLEISYTPWDRIPNANAVHQDIDTWARRHTVNFGFGQCQAIRGRFPGC